jgi:hypothetical protein
MPTKSLLDKIKNPKLKELLRRLSRHGLQETKEIVLEPDRFYSWNKEERKQFMNALEMVREPYFGYYINEKKLPKRHPAIRIGYSLGDLTSAYLTLLDEFEKKSRKMSQDYMIRGCQASIA